MLIPKGFRVIRTPKGDPSMDTGDFQGKSFVVLGVGTDGSQADYNVQSDLSVLIEQGAESGDSDGIVFHYLRPAREGVEPEPDGPWWIQPQLLEWTTIDPKPSGFSYQRVMADPS